MDDLINLKVRESKLNVISYMKQVYKLANILALAPPYNFDYIEKNNLVGTYKYYPIAMAIFVTTTYVYGMYGIVKKVFPLAQTTTIVIQVLFYLFIVSSNLMSMLGGGFYNWKAWNEMLDIFAKVDSQVGFSRIQKKSVITAFYIHIICGHALLLSVYSFDIYVGSTNYGMNIYQHYLCVRYQYYFIFIEVILMCNFAISIKQRFKYFNKMLKTISTNNNKKIFVVKTKSISYAVPTELNSFGLNNLKSITRMFTVLSELIHLYNKIFGWQILILLGMVLLSLLESFNFIMVYGISVKETFGQNSPFDMICLSLLTTFVFLVNISLLKMIEILDYYAPYDLLFNNGQNNSHKAKV